VLSRRRRADCTVCASQVFSEGPKFAQRQHPEVVHNGKHHIEGEVFLPLFNVAKVELFTTDSRRRSGLRLALPGAQLGYRQAENLSWCTGLSRYVCSNSFGHTIIVAKYRRLI
jgi:hypothetical protein